MLIKKFNNEGSKLVKLDASQVFYNEGGALLNTYLNNNKPVTLYESSTGSTASISLNDIYTKYKFIDIYYGETINVLNSYGVCHQRVDTSVSSRVNLQLIDFGHYWGSIVSSYWDFSESNLNFIEGWTLGGNNGQITSWWSAYSGVRVYKVIGYL